ncbi:MAG TPA: MauE/DoxX family redox-associated membrane protein [Acidimicrobiales bacterium]|nr:MauE/DoxX family redox-associated membrane protein [Acidimicrobiales bacterium]
MNGVAYAAALVTAGVLGWAGIAKWQRPRGTAASFAGLGLPAPETLARAVPLAELVVAALLVVVPRAGAIGAFVLLSAFSVVLFGAVRRGTEVGCACFGAAKARPVSSVDLVRNAGLLGFAGVAALADGPTMPALADVIAVSTAFVGGLVVLHLLDLRRAIGRVWDTRLAGEPQR